MAEHPPLIVVQGLSKVFAGGQVALSGVSFTARPGGVLGFLGPNGAGKTTTMRILSGYLRPTAGSAQICGHDVREDSLAARRHVGYLPEQVPLPPDLRVHEYLRFRAELRGLPRARRRVAAEEAMEAVGLRGEADRVIGQLSKGYRQRVGLADALLHRPEVLILDEPTDGLDPNQRREVLDLVALLGQERTVVLSTHVLPEVETVCREVVILDRGRVVAAGPTADLLRRLLRHDRVELRCRGDLGAILAALRAVPGVLGVEPGAAVGEARADAAAAGDEAAGTDKAVHDVRVQLSPAGAAEAERCCEELARAVLSCAALQRMQPARSGLEALFRWVTQHEEGEGRDASEKTAAVDAGAAAS